MTPVCDFCLADHAEDVLLVKSVFKPAHVCEECVREAAKLIATHKAEAK